MKRFFSFFLILALPLSACLWDRDTIRAELRGQIGTVKTLVGWFNRYPPLYYQQRLERVEAELVTHPAQASLYDDAAVACDRLGDPTTAIAWMEKKQKLAREEEVAPGGPSTRYKTLANLGTFHAHRWIQETKAGKNPSKQDLEKAIELVAAAITENPQAHFNREKYQLLLLQWLNGEENVFSEMVEASFFPRGLNLEEKGYQDLEEGLLGLIRLGAAWESPDIFFLLQSFYGSERLEHPRLLANLRIAELIANEKNFLSPQLEPVFTDPAEISPGGFGSALSSNLVPTTISYYEDARRSVEQREKLRTAYLLKGLENGSHPDTDPGFWDGWEEPDFPELPRAALQQWLTLERAVSIVVGVLSLLLLLVIAQGICKVVKPSR